METNLEAHRAYAEQARESSVSVNESSGASAGRGALLMVSSSFVVALLNYGLSVVLGWALPTNEYGRVGVIQTIIFVCVWFLGAGFPWVVTRTIAQAKGAEPHDKPEGESAWRTYKTAWAANLVLTLLVTLALLAAFQWHLLPLEAEYGPLIIVAAITIAALGIGAVPDAGLQGLFRFGRISLVRVSEAVVNVVASIALVVAGFGAAGALGGFGVAAVLACVLDVAFIRDKDFMRTKGWGGLATVRLAIPMTFAVFGGVLLTNIDLLSVKFLSGANSDTLTGTYQVAAVLARAPYFVGTALVSAYYPRIARELTTSHGRTASSALLRWTTMGVLPMNVIMLAGAPAVVGFFFPGRYSGAASSLAVLALGSAGLITAGALAAILQAHGHARITGTIMTLAVALQVVGLAVAVPLYGAIGAASVSCVAALLGCALLIIQARKHNTAHLPGGLRQFMALGVLALAMLPLGLVFPTAPRPVVALWVIGCVLIYISLLFVFRLINASEMAPAASKLGTGFGGNLAKRAVAIGASLNRIGGAGITDN